ncbi:DUF726 domain-containing protein [Aliivibrio fischeri]|uniref:DUF726 domain-containing protein n=1 Tax=Aliivibrio fischeri TaxID=668 RepID=UPI0012DA26A6|nr:DUF726 domain-containing protein [Aliivibrio fischeri]MUJ38263.1 DUF726 domain-containing protein [Aliivibrio fischeri]
MINKFKASIPGFDVNSLLKSVKDSLTEPSTKELELRASPSCELIKVREGKLPSVVIINGFMTQNEDCSKDWLEVVDELYPDNQVIRVQWKAGNLKDMVFDKGVVPNARIASGSKIGFAATLMARTNLIGMIATAGGFVVDKVIGHWKTSFHETRHVALSLTNHIESDAQFENCILMGHSLGGRILRHTLNELSTANIVSEAYVLAGAVSSDDEQWQSILEKHNRLKLINCMSMKDYVLKSAYKAGTLWDHEPAGLFPVMEANENTVNLDVTEYASGHTDYKQKSLGQYLKQELLQ